MRTWSASRSTSENTATDVMPCSRQARITRTAISPRFATRTFEIFIEARSSSRAELEAREEVRDLGRGRLGGVGAVDRVGLDGRGEILADRAGRRLGRIGGAHELPPPLDRVLGLEDHRQARSLGHEVAEALEKRSRAVDRVEAGRIDLRHVDHLGRENLEARALHARDDMPGNALAYRIGFDDGQRALHHRPITRAIVAPMSAGLMTSVAPAFASAFIFSAAVPFPPAMIAPA